MKFNSAIILCGGKGTRLGSISKKIPKTLVKIQKKEILWYIIEFLKKNNFNHFILPLGYKGNYIRNFVKKNNFFGSNVDLINTGTNTNIGNRIYKVQKKIKSDNVLILNGDAIFNFNMKKIFRDHAKHKIDASFLSAESKYQFGTVCVKRGKLTDFQRNIIFESVNVRNDKSIKAFNYAGLIVLKKDKLFKYSNIFKKSDNFEKYFYPILIKKHKTKIIKINGLFHSIDNMKDIELGNLKSKDKIYKNIKITKKNLLKKYEIKKTN